MPNTLNKLMYVSQAAETAWLDIDTVVKDIMVASYRNNPQRDVTGGLLVLDRFFLQVLEGRKADIDVIYDKIASDTRHEKLRVLRAQPIAARDFGRWSMCCERLSATDAAIVDLLMTQRGVKLDDLSPGLAEHLLKTIRDIKLKRSRNQVRLSA